MQGQGTEPRRAGAPGEAGKGNGVDMLMFMACLGWGVFAGGVFSSIGAAGGILTSFGLITLFGVTEPNSVKPMTQIIVLTAVLIFVPRYLRRSALVWPLGLMLGGGGLVGAYLGSTLSTLYLSDMTAFRPLFGGLTLAVAAQITWTLYRGGNPAPVAGAPAGPVPGLAVTGTRFSGGALSFDYGDSRFRVPVWSPLLAGAGIAMAASIFGVGGGFLLVPYMVAVLGMPMHIIPATAAIAIGIALVMSIGNFVALGAQIDVGLLIPLAIGTVIGAMSGPQVNRALRNGILQAVMAVIVAAIGLYYLFA